MANFIPNIDPDSCRFLNLRMMLRSQPCVHCGNRESLKAHGFLRSSNRILRGIRLYCSDRDSNSGCGRTFSIHFEKYLPHASHDASQVAEIIGSQCQPPDIKDRPSLREIIGSICSKSTAYRWLKQFEVRQELVRSRLYLISAPDRNVDGRSLSRTWQHLQNAFHSETCALTAFQGALQMNPFSYRHSGLPIYHRVLSEWLREFWTATRNGILERRGTPMTAGLSDFRVVNTG